MIERLAHEIEEKYSALLEQLADPEVLRDQARYTEISKAHSDLEAAYRLAVAYREARESVEEADAMLNEGGLDPEMKEFLTEEKATARDSMEALEQDLRLAVLEKDPRDEKNVIVEVRAGAGGDEAALFAAEIQRMVMRYAERLRFKTEILSTTEAALGGVKEVIFEVKGRGAYGALKYESGVHRVQRVPVTESTGQDTYLHCHCGRASRGRGSRDQHRSERCTGGRLSLDRPGWPIGEHHRLRCASDPCPHRLGGLVPG